MVKGKWNIKALTLRVIDSGEEFMLFVRKVEIVIQLFNFLLI